MELQLLACARAIATPDVSHLCDLHHSSWQHWILNPLSEPRDRTCNLMIPSRIHFFCAMMGTPMSSILGLTETVWKNRGIVAGFQGAGMAGRMVNTAIYPPRIKSYRYLEGEFSFCSLGYFKSRDLSSCCGSVETNPTRKHEVAGSIPGLARWVKDQLLP